MRMIWTRSLPLAAALALTFACGDDGGEDGSNDDFGTPDTGDTGGDEAEAGTTEGGTDAGTDDGTGDTTDAEADTQADAEAEAEADAEEGETAGGGCADLDSEEACNADANCQSVLGSKLKTNGANAPCLQEVDFIGCIDAQGCGDALTWFCNGNQIYEVLDTCGPEGFEMCEPPRELNGACP
ncbi:hypothetical protein PPSIR1_21774 [Plesiocystis pacifica SIR-1]|uniref:Lipoprotein n=1 Tax=Plesiocystis pacifica SIR-1 TaxID=391625 RepID=A6FXK2_9BACT|nr:hypothetical protein [Plesiocystis pacifica]EDM81590.1 hypothetical protein PPSIR1_21774 [Plesiocystis pacifica SIR-1]